MCNSFQPSKNLRNNIKVKVSATYGSIIIIFCEHLPFLDYLSFVNETFLSNHQVILENDILVKLNKECNHHLFSFSIILRQLSRRNLCTKNQFLPTYQNNLRSSIKVIVYQVFSGDLLAYYGFVFFLIFDYNIQNIGNCDNCSSHFGLAIS